MYFAVESFLESLGLEYKDHGVNVPRNACNIQCIYCGEKRFHLVIRRNKDYSNCWVCGENTTVVKVVKDLLHCGWREAREVVHGRRHLLFEMTPEEEEKPQRAEVCVLPKYTVPIVGMNPGYSTAIGPMQVNAYKYLHGRGIGSEKMHRHNLHFGYGGEQAYRIVIPMHFGGRLVTYTGRDFTGKSNIRYKSCSTENSVLVPTEFLFGLDDFTGSRVIVVEGQLDKIVMGDDTLGASTNKLSPVQKKMLCGLMDGLDLMELDFVLDPEAQDEAEELAEYFRPIIDRIKVARLPAGEDPASYGRDKTLRAIAETDYFDF